MTRPLACLWCPRPAVLHERGRTSACIRHTRRLYVTLHNATERRRAAGDNVTWFDGMGSSPWPLWFVTAGFAWPDPDDVLRATEALDR